MLSQTFYERADVTVIAKELLGKKVVTTLNGQVTSGIIVETEAYSGSVERGSHAYPMKRTERTSVMFKAGGIAYVYLCYGVHHLFNVVTNVEGQPDAVLIRALEPVDGVEIMQQRRTNMRISNLTSGPGKLSAALGITTEQHNKISLSGPEIWIEEAEKFSEDRIASAPRIGIDYAGDDALLPWRYYLRENAYVSQF